MKAATFALMSTMMTAALVGPSVAHAEMLLYSLTSADGDISFEVDSNPSVTDAAEFQAESGYFYVSDVTISQQNGVIPGDYVYFSNTANQGGLGDPAIAFTGAQLFSGTASDPTLLLESNVALTPVGEKSNKANNYTLNVTAVSAAPEPSAWILMTLGVGLMGAALRYGRRLDQAAITA